MSAEPEEQEMNEKSIHSNALSLDAGIGGRRASFIVCAACMVSAKQYRKSKERSRHECGRMGALLTKAPAWL